MKSFAFRTGHQDGQHAVRPAVAPEAAPSSLPSAARDDLRAALQAPQIQAKLEVSQPDDPLELEADRVADQVMAMRMPAEGEASAVDVQQAGAGGIQRACAGCEGGSEDEEGLF